MSIITAASDNKIAGFVHIYFLQKHLLASAVQSVQILVGPRVAAVVVVAAAAAVGAFDACDRNSYHGLCVCWSLLALTPEQERETENAMT